MQFKLPELGEGVHEGELVKWSVKVGDSVKYDQPLCEIMTDKATVEIPSAFQGKVASLHVKEGQIVHVGELLLTFEGAEQTKSATGAETRTGAGAGTGTGAVSAATTPAASATAAKAPQASPSVSGQM